MELKRAILISIILWIVELFALFFLAIAFTGAGDGEVWIDVIFYLPLVVLTYFASKIYFGKRKTKAGAGEGAKLGIIFLIGWIVFNFIKYSLFDLFEVWDYVVRGALVFLIPVIFGKYKK